MSIIKPSHTSPLLYQSIYKSINLKTSTRLYSLAEPNPSSTPLSPPSSPNTQTPISTPLKYDPSNPLGWCTSFGSINLSKNSTIHQVSIPPTHPDYIEVSDLQVKGVVQVTTVEEARLVLERLEASLNTDVIHACDTEVMDIDLKSSGPVGNGLVTCLTMYSGPTFDYGIGEPGSALFVDNLDKSAGVLEEFKGFFENEGHRKCWHNYGFDRHVMFNMGIDCKGFAADTMHMARLEDSSRMKFGGGGGGYGLEALTDDILGRRKRPMKEIFGKGKLKKDGTEGAVIEIPPIEVIQRRREHRQKWISYAAYDAEGTWMLRQELENR